MSTFTRRTFVQLSAGTLLSAASNKLLAETQTASVATGDGLVSVRGANYAWDYTQASDTFRLRDSKNRLIASGKLQAAVVVAPAGQPSLRICTPGKAIEPRVETGRITFAYEGVNGNGRLLLPWRFDEQTVWMEPLVYETPEAQEVVSLHYFSNIHDTEASPALHANYLVVPGINEGSTVSPIVRDTVGLNQNVWLGRGSSSPGWIQQWALPVHYFCGFSVGSTAPLRNALTEGRSDAFACGLADLPGGDFYLQLSEGKGSPWIDYRSDLWKQLSGPGRLQLGATFLWCVGADYYKAIAGYY